MARKSHAAAITPAGRAHPVTENVEIEATKALYIGVGGDLVVRMAGEGNVVTFKNVPDGASLAIEVDRVETSTTATDIVALY
jgi:hypothetical protein